MSDVVSGKSAGGDDKISPEDLVEASTDSELKIEDVAPSGATQPSGLTPRSSEGKKPRSKLMTGLTRNVFVLGAVSFFTDMSSEMIVPIRILFLVIVLRTPLPVAGLIEGIAESTSSLLKIVAGRLSDHPSRRKPLIFFGYTLSNGVKPILAFVTAWPIALILIFFDRVGKGVRGVPRDAMMADSTPREHMGKAFGFHRSMDTLGAAVGPLFTYFILFFTGGDLRAVFMWTLLPGILSVIVMVLFLRERRASALESRRQEAEGNIVNRNSEIENPKLEKRKFRASELGTRFWMFTIICTIFALGNSSDAFIFLRTTELETSIAAVPLIYFAYNLVYAALATPLGVLSDRWGRIPVLMFGFFAFGLVYLGWAYATQGWEAWVLFVIYGIYAAATEGVAKAFITDLVPKEARGTAIGWFSGMTGFASLPANVIGGWLWGIASAPATFIFGAWMSGLALGLLIAWLPWLRSKPNVEMTPAVS